MLILRVGVAGMMLCHGWPKLLLLVQGRGGEWMDPLGWGAELSLALCVFAEFFCSLALLVGLMTRLAALVLVVNFWVVIFVYGEQSSWAQNELPLLYLLCFVSLVCLGGWATLSGSLVGPAASQAPRRCRLPRHFVSSFRENWSVIIVQLCCILYFSKKGSFLRRHIWALTRF